MKSQFFLNVFPAKLQMKLADAADSKQFLFVDSNPATNPDKTSPVPPTVIAGVFFSTKISQFPFEIISVGPFSKIVIPISKHFVQPTEFFHF